MPTLKKIGVLTGGGDAPASTRSSAPSSSPPRTPVSRSWASKTASTASSTPNKSRRLTPADVRGMLRLGGTMLGTVNRGNSVQRNRSSRREGRSTTPTACVEMFHMMGLDAPRRASAATAPWRFRTSSTRWGIPLVCVPKTIDNDIVGTTSCFGFDTAVSFATDAIDRLHTTAEAHHRMMVVEVMGRYAGWIALHAGVAGGADVILIPEIPYDLDEGVGRAIARARAVRRPVQHRGGRRGRALGARRRSH